MNGAEISRVIIEPPLPLVLLLAAALAAVSYGMRWLTASGAVATFIVGIIIFGLGGGIFTVPLLTFFVSSSLLSKLRSARKRKATLVAAKGSRRDAAQVCANGGLAALLVILFWLEVRAWSILHTRYLLMLYLAALASVNSDTWATEIGGFSPWPPRLLSTGRPVKAGESGAVSGLGLLGALLGSLIIPLSVFAFWNLSIAEFVTVAWSGFLGSLIDSLLGAGPQAKYRDRLTGMLTENPSTDGQANVHVRGIAWINNDVVNFLASVGGTLCALALLYFCTYPVH